MAERKEMEKFDASKYVGTHTKIASATVCKGEVKGKETMFLHIKSEEIKLKDGDQFPKDKILTASVIFGFQRSDEGWYVGIGSRLDKFLQSKKISETDITRLNIAPGESLKALVGKQCITQLNDKGFLELI